MVGEVVDTTERSVEELALPWIDSSPIYMAVTSMAASPVK